MKFVFAALASVVAASGQTPQVEKGLGMKMPFGNHMSAEEKHEAQKENTLWYAAGVKGFYSGFYKSFYKSSMPEGMDKCLDDETIENVMAVQGLFKNPIKTFSSIANIQNDVKEFSQLAEIMENLSTCKFEKAGIDIVTMCTKDMSACSLSTLTQNVSKDMFVLVGKLTSLAEMFQDFPSKDKWEFEEECRELGATAGTWARVVFNYHQPGEATTSHHYHHHETEDY